MTMTTKTLRFLLSLSFFSLALGWRSSLLSSSNQPPVSSSSSPSPSSRREWFLQTAAGTAAMTALVSHPSSSQAAAIGTNKNNDKLLNLSNEELAQILERDVTQNQFMVKADLTRSVYDETATFTDEIDTYGLDQWIVGTKRLFVPDKSRVALEANTLQVGDLQASFRFQEYLTFNIPILQPMVFLSGTVLFQRDGQTGLITSYQEKWDQDINTVLKSAKWFGPPLGTLLINTKK